MYFVHVMKACEEVEVWLLQFLNSILGGGQGRIKLFGAPRQ